MVGPSSTGISRAPAYSGIVPAVSIFSLTGLSPSMAGFPNTVQLKSTFVTAWELCRTPLYEPITPTYATPAGLHVFGLGYSPFAHHYLGNLFRFLFYPATEMFHFADSAPATAGSRPTAGGLPHSDTFGSRVACASPKLFAAYRVLRR